MTDIQNMRAQLRDTRGRPAVHTSSGGGNGVMFWIVAAVAGAVGFAIVLLTPRYFTAQRTAALPAFQQANRAEPAESVPAVAQPPVQAVPAQPAAAQPVTPQPAAAMRAPA